MKRLVLGLLLAGIALAAEAPGWLREVATAATPAYAPKVKAVVLLAEERVVVEVTGKRTVTVRKAMKILNREGRVEARGGFDYDSRGSRVRDFKAWVIHPQGRVKEFSRKEIQEGISQPEFMLYSTRRQTSVNAVSEVDAGAVFGYEGTLEEDSVFSQFLWWFQDDLPALRSRFQLTVPVGWKAEAKAYRGAKAEAAVDGQTYTWEEKNLAPVEWEPGAPRFATALPRVAVSLVAPDDNTAGGIACFRNWKDVSRWKSGLADPQALVTAAIESKVGELTAGAKSEREKVEGLARFAQSIRYVAIATNSSRGGGYVPHKADEVLKMAYGDCKDKTNLLRTMLKAIGVESYPVAIYSGDSRYTMEDFPSPHQFNHAILAIRIGEGWTGDAVGEYEGLGKLLFFDPTDTAVPLGSLPDHEQDSFALVTAGELGALVRTPPGGEEANVVERRWRLKLEGEGDIAGEFEEVLRGQAAFQARRRLESLGKGDYDKAIGSGLGRWMAGTEVATLESEIGVSEVRHRVRFKAPGYAKVLQGRLWMVKSMPMQAAGLPEVNRAERKQPLVVKRLRYLESVDWELPEGLVADEIPQGWKANWEKGKMETQWRSAGRTLAVQRELWLESGLVEAGSYQQVRAHLMRFHGAGESAMVLLRK